MSEKLLEMKHFRVLLYPEGPDWAPPGPPESFAIGKMRETPPNGRNWMYNRHQDEGGKMEILAKRRLRDRVTKGPAGQDFSHETHA